MLKGSLMFLSSLSSDRAPSPALSSFVSHYRLFTHCGAPDIRHHAGNPRLYHRDAILISTILPSTVATCQRRVRTTGPCFKPLRQKR